MEDGWLYCLPFVDLWDRRDQRQLAVSRSGIIPISATQDTAGPMCRTVADALAVLLTVLAAQDPADEATVGNTRAAGLRDLPQS